MPFIGTKWKTVSTVVTGTSYSISVAPIVVHCIVLTFNGTGKKIIEWRDNDGTLLFDMQNDNLLSFVFNARWVADNGLNAVCTNGTSSMYVSVLYSYPGAD